MSGSTLSRGSSAMLGSLPIYEVDPQRTLVRVRKTEEALLVKGLLVSMSLTLETSRTSTRVAKEESKDANVQLLAVHTTDVTPLAEAVNSPA